MKKITKNNKGFSLIELIIVIAIMAVLVAIIAPNLTKYLGSSKTKTDQKNADELASQIQTCITEYDTDQSTSLGASIGAGTMSISWSGKTATSSNPSDTTFDGIVNANITSDTKSKENGSSASASITYNSTTKVYSITVTVGNATATK